MDAENRHCKKQNKNGPKEMAVFPPVERKKRRSPRKNESQ
jgi:hypothetical protein